MTAFVQFLVTSSLLAVYLVFRSLLAPYQPLCSSLGEGAILLGGVEDMVGDVFLVETPKGFLIDPDYYCPAEPGTKKPLTTLKDGLTYEIGDETCRKARQMIAYFNSEPTESMEIERMRVAVLFVAMAIMMIMVGLAAASSHMKPTDIMASPCNGRNVKITRAQHDANTKSREECPYNREDIVTFIKNWHNMTDDSVGICLDEIYQLEKKHLSAALIHVLNQIETPETIVARCDCNNDGCISLWDFEHSMDTCLRDCDSLRRVRKFLIDPLDPTIFAHIVDARLSDEAMLANGKVINK